MEAGWIMPKGRKETVGRPVTWGTTDAFMMQFGLASLADLPGLDELRAAGLIGPRPDLVLTETAPQPEGEPEDEDEIEEPEQNGEAAE
jgi:segregation and condensation protein B